MFENRKPRIIHRQCGGWLARSAPEDTVQIGVTAPTEEGAAALFAQRRAAWQVMLEQPQPVTASDCGEASSASAHDGALSA